MLLSFIQNISPFLICKTTCIIHHKQLLLTTFGKNFVILNQWRQKCSLLQIIELMMWKWHQKGLQIIEPLTDWRNLGMRSHYFWSRERVHFQRVWNILNKQWSNIIEFSFRRIWSVLPILEGVIHLSLGLGG